MHANLDVVNEVVRELIERTRERTRELLEHAKDGEASFIGPAPRRVVRNARSMDDAVRAAIAAARQARPVARQEPTVVEAGA